MATLTRSTSASMDTSTGMFAPQISGDLIAGEALDIAAPCYIKASDGKVYMSNGTADTEPARVFGFTPRAASAGEPVTLMGAGARFRYGSGLTIGTQLYPSGTAGRLDDAATTGGDVACAVVISATDIVVTRADGA